jgi:hypothetical protein
MTDDPSKQSKRYPSFNLNTNGAPLMLKTPKQVVEGVLAITRIDLKVQGKAAARIVYALHDACIPDVPMNLYDPASWKNPTLDVDWQNLPLWDAFKAVCDLCEIHMEVTDKGELNLWSWTAQEKLNNALLQVEEWQKVKNGGLNG